MLAATNPRFLEQLTGKRRPFDVIGAILLLASALLVLRVCRQIRRENGFGYWRWLAFGGLLWFAGMEEIGWGHEALRWHLPRPEVGGVHVDALHDLFGLVRHLGASRVILLMQGALLAGILAIALLVGTRAGRSIVRSWTPGIAVPIALGVCLVLSALILDTRTAYLIWFLEKRPPYGLEEATEFLAEVSVCLAAFEGWLRHRSAVARHGPAAEPGPS